MKHGGSTFLISVCVAGGDVAHDLDALEILAARVSDRFRYWEIVYVLGESQRGELPPLAGRLARLANLRTLIVNDGDNHYRRRRIAAFEAIGDVVVISDLGEAASLDLADLAEEALSSGQIVLATRPRGRAMSALLHAPLRLLSGYRVNTRDLRTIALPRTNLTRMLARHTASIDFRFEPKRSPERYARKTVDAPRDRDPLWRSRRFDLVVEIVSASGPRFLKGLALLSLAVLTLSGFYALYAVGVVLLDPGVQPGWFTTAIAQSGLTMFMGLIFVIMPLAQARVLELLQASSRDEVLDEIGNVAFFDRTDDLNVHLSSPDKREADR